MRACGLCLLCESITILGVDSISMCDRTLFSVLRILMWLVPNAVTYNSFLLGAQIVSVGWVRVVVRVLGLGSWL